MNAASAVYVHAHAYAASMQTSSPIEQVKAKLSATAIKQGYAQEVAEKFAALYVKGDLGNIGRLSKANCKEGQLTLRQVLHLVRCSYKL